LKYCEFKEQNRIYMIFNLDNFKYVYNEIQESSFGPLTHKYLIEFEKVVKCVSPTTHIQEPW